MCAAATIALRARLGGPVKTPSSWTPISIPFAASAVEASGAGMSAETAARRASFLNRMLLLWSFRIGLRRQPGADGRVALIRHRSSPACARVYMSPTTAEFRPESRSSSEVDPAAAILRILLIDGIWTCQPVAHRHRRAGPPARLRREAAAGARPGPRLRDARVQGRRHRPRLS